jgi:hypothetical protein
MGPPNHAGQDPFPLYCIIVTLPIGEFQSIKESWRFSGRCGKYIYCCLAPILFRYVTLASAMMLVK